MKNNTGMEGSQAMPSSYGSVARSFDGFSGFDLSCEELPITFGAERECTIASGTWLDPYSGETFTDPDDLDIDHFVPLKNAHSSGGWRWNRARKREYANFLGNDSHLLAVRDRLNQEKGDKGPDRWKPPREEYWCEYARTWEKIKGEWDLTMT